MTVLCDLAFKYGSDKCPQIKHFYTQFYYDLLKDRRESVRKVVEIGIGCPQNMNDYPGYRIGASLYMWRDFFPNAMIYGADILPESMFQDERIRTVLCDQTVSMDLVRLVEETGSDIDLFIDDGCHVPVAQLFTCLTVVPLLDEKAIYIIEDVGTIGIIHGLRDGLKEYNCRRVGRERKLGRDDRLIMVTRKEEGSG